jgi:hypothetical protein
MINMYGFFERLFGIAPDGGNGSFELASHWLCQERKLLLMRSRAHGLTHDALHFVWSEFGVWQSF